MPTQCLHLSRLLGRNVARSIAIRAEKKTLVALVGCLALGAPYSPPRAEEPGPTRPADRRAELLFNTASRLYRQKDWKEAAAAFDDFLAAYPSHSDAREARFARGYCRGRLGLHAQAVEDLRRAAQSPQKRWAADASFYLARSLAALAELSDDPRKAEKYLLEAAEHYGVAAERYGAGSEAQASDTATAGETPPGDFRLLAILSRAESLYRCRHYNEVEEVLGPLSRPEGPFVTSSHLPRALYLLAAARYAAGTTREGDQGPRDPREIEEPLRRVVAPRFEKDPYWEEAAFLLGRVLQAQKRHSEARGLLLKVEKLGGARATESRFYAALASYEQGTGESRRQAMAEFARFARENPQHEWTPRALLYQGLSLFEEKRYEEAAKPLGRVAAGTDAVAAMGAIRLGQSLLLGEKPDTVRAAQALERALTIMQPTSAARIDGNAAARAEAMYWLAEAWSAQGGEAMSRAAGAYAKVATEFQAEAPELAEKALYQQARLAFLAEDRRECVRLARLYRQRYPSENGAFYVASLELSGANALAAEEGEIDAAEKAKAATYYLEASALAGSRAEKRRLGYLAGLAHYRGGDFPRAIDVLSAIEKDSREDPDPKFSEPALSYYLADALVQSASEAVPGEESLQHWRRAADLLDEYLSRPANTEHRANALINRGLCGMRLGEPDAARRPFEEFLSSHRDHPLLPRVRFELATAYRSLGDVDRALGQYREAARSSKDAVLAAESILQAAGLEEARSRHAEAAKLLETIAGNPPPALRSERPGLVALAHFQLALSLLKGGNIKDARRRLEEHITKFPGSPHLPAARVELAHVLLDTADPQEALAVLAPVTGGAAPDGVAAQALYLRAWSRRRLAERAAKEEAGSGSAPTASERHLREAETAYRELIARYPKSPIAADATVELAQELFNRGRHDEAKVLFERVVTTLGSSENTSRGDAPEDPRPRDLLNQARFGLGFLAFGDEDYIRAAQLFDQVAAEGTKELVARAVFQSGRALMLTKQEKEAAQRFERLVKTLHQPASDAGLLEEAYLRLGECRHRIGRLDDAAAALDSMLKTYPSGRLQHEGRFALGFVLQDKGELDRAMAHYRLVVGSSEDVIAARAQYHIGECLSDRGEHRNAAREYLTVVANFDFGKRYDEWVRRALLGAGLAYEAAGEKETAHRQFEEIVQRFPQSEEARAARNRLGEEKQ